MRLSRIASISSLPALPSIFYLNIHGVAYASTFFEYGIFFLGWHFQCFIDGLRHCCKALVFDMQQWAEMDFLWQVRHHFMPKCIMDILQRYLAENFCDRHFSKKWRYCILFYNKKGEHLYWYDASQQTYLNFLVLFIVKYVPFQFSINSSLNWREK